MSELDLTGKTAVVTGAAGVLCSEFCRALYGRGANVALLDLNYDKAASAAALLGERALAVRCDVLSSASLAQAHNEVARRFGKCDILINGAGGNNARATTTNEYYSDGDLENAEIKSFFDLDADSVSFVFDLNFKGALLTTQAFAPDMLHDGGNIINISSMNAYRPLTKIPAYSAAKAAVSNFTMWLAVHFAKQSIRVNAIAPGFFITAQNRDLLLNADGSYTKRSEKILAATPAGRFGEPRELLGTLLFLCNDDASGFITGTVIPVDGGFSAYSGV